MATAVLLSNKINSLEEDTVIGLDSVENFSVTRSAKATSHPMEDGSLVSDNYAPDPLTVSFSGVVTPWNFTGGGVDETPLEFIASVNALMDEAVVFDLFLSEDLQSIPSCIITSFLYKREAKEGNSILVDISLQQVDTQNAAVESSIETLFLAQDVAQQGQGSQDKGDEVTNTYFGSLLVSGGKVIDIQDSTFEKAGFIP